MTTAMIRVEPDTRAQVLRVARDDYGGVSADEALRLLLLEHQQRLAIEAWDRFRDEQPSEWESYVSRADADDRATGLPAPEWTA